jgi:hypothetical protein
MLMIIKDYVLCSNRNRFILFQLDYVYLMQYYLHMDLDFDVDYIAILHKDSHNLLS